MRAGRGRGKAQQGRAGSVGPAMEVIVTVSLSAQGTQACPFRLQRIPNEAQALQFSTRITFSYPFSDLSKLLRWLSEVSPSDASASVSFPASLSNEQRRVVHEAANKLQLCSLSHGADERRFVRVSAPHRSVDKFPQRPEAPACDFFVKTGTCPWVGLGWVGLGWVGLGWVGLGWVWREWPSYKDRYVQIRSDVQVQSPAAGQEHDEDVWQWRPCRASSRPR
jgi:hypothetical protein